MNDMSIARVIALLRGGYPSTKLDEDTYTVWAAKLAPLDERDVIPAVDEHLAESMFFPTIHELMTRIARRRDEARIAAARSRALPMAQCDGTGFIPNRDWGLTPCRRCNPALAQVWADPATFTAYRDGKPLEQLNVGVERHKGVLRYVSGIVPPRCEPAWEHDDPTVESARGRAVALAAYLRECHDRGREPKMRAFDAWFGLAERRAQRTAHVT